MYNNIITCLHPVEEPLISDRIKMMDEILAPGINDLKWNSTEISQFISKAMTNVDGVNIIVIKMKTDLERI